ncbi:unnamed protein product [Adineta steineri]|nr:unnamed protein product [Adineta steineri]
MNDYIQAFNNGLNYLPDNCDLTGLYCRLTKGITDDDFFRLSQDPTKRLTWVYDHETLRSLLGMSHLEMLIHSGHTIEWIRHQLEGNKKFKLIIFSVPSDEIKLATWDNLFEILSKAYPEIDSNIWYRYSSQLKEMTYKEIDPEGIILRNYYLGPTSDGHMHTNRFLSLKDQPTLLQVRAFLHHQIGLNELYGGDGKTITHLGDVVDKEYITVNRPLNELKQCAILDLNPILP